MWLMTATIAKDHGRGLAQTQLIYIKRLGVLSAMPQFYFYLSKPNLLHHLCF